MKKYNKGIRWERELLEFLNYKGFSCIRSASSGGYYFPVDVVAIKKSLVLAFECKSWKTKPSLSKKDFEKFKKWCEKAGAWGFLAWRKNKDEWLFLPLKNIEKNEYQDDKWIKMEKLLDTFIF